MKKEESLNFLQSCMEKVKNASAREIQNYKEVYEKYSTASKKVSEFEFVVPTNTLQYHYKMDVCNLIINETVKTQKEYNFSGSNLLNQQNDDNLPYAA